MANKFSLYAGGVVLIACASAWAMSTLFTGNASVKLPDCYQERVCDSEDLFTPDQKENLETYHKALLERYDIDVRIMTATISPEIVNSLFKQAKIGEESKTRKGVMLIVDPQQNIVRMEVSAGLDAVYTDGFVAYIQQRQMVPFFKANRVADGILATAEMIVARAQQAQEGKEFIPPEQLPQNLAIGAGAQTKAEIGKGYQAPVATGNLPPEKMNAGDDPASVVAAYHRILAAGNADASLPIYSQATQAMRQKWVVTPAQMKNELQAYAACDVDQTIVLKKSGLAVVRYKIAQRQCAPYFLVYEDGAWRLDFAAMMQYIRFNVSNEWHMDMSKPLPYADAFRDWSFNKDGYPFPMKKMRWGLNVMTDKRHHVTYVNRIFPNTPAVDMPLREKDIILSWDGMDNPDYRQVVQSMDRLENGQAVKVIISRDGQELTVNLVAPPRI